MSGEATARSTSGAEPLDRAFGRSARCSRCALDVEAYRVIALFLHDTAAVRAYCPACYEVALAGEYHARGDGVLLDYATFARRFGAPGPAPPRATPVDRVLAALLASPDLRVLSPPSEGLARRRGTAPYPFAVEFETSGQVGRARFELGSDGACQRISGDESACGRVNQVLTGSR